MLRFLSSWLPVILWAAIILSAANDEFSEGNTRGWLDQLFGGEVPAILNAILRKGGHIVAYSLLGLLTWRAHRTLLVSLLVVIVVAITDESMQAMTATRGGSVFDVALDTFAALLALLLVPGVRAALRRHRE